MYEWIVATSYNNVKMLQTKDFCYYSNITKKFYILPRLRKPQLPHIAIHNA